MKNEKTKTFNQLDIIEEIKTNEEPTNRNEPAQEEPVQETPAQEEPVKEEPAQEEPVQETPAQEEPVKEEPVKEEPAQEEPVQEEPVKKETRGRKPKKPNDEQARKNAFGSQQQATSNQQQEEKKTTQQLIFLDGETLVGLIDLGGQAAGVLLGKFTGKKITPENFALTENEKKAIEKPAHEVGKDLYLTPVQVLALALTSIYYNKYASL